MRSELQAAPRLTARGAVTRQRIVDAASELVYEFGVAGTSVDDVLAASGTSKSQLYHYFADKDALVREVVRTQTRKVIEGQQAELEAIHSMTGLKRWRNRVVQSTREAGGVGGCPLGSLVSELADQSEAARLVLVECFATWEDYLVRGLASMRDRGRLEPDCDPQTLATAIMTALQGGLLLAQTTRSVEPLEIALDMALGHVAQRAA